MYEIKDDVELPKLGSWQKGQSTTYPFAGMQVGQAFVQETKTLPARKLYLNRFRSASNVWARNHGQKFAVRYDHQKEIVICKRVG